MTEDHATGDQQESMPIERYLAQGGKLTAPDNAPPRYRGELLRIMASFVDSELAGSAGFADTINDAPGITPRIAAARIVLEKVDHAERVLNIMGSFGADTQRYAVHHPWAARIERDASLGLARHGSDMRLAVFHYPLQGWVDAVVLNVLMGLATEIQLAELSLISYQPLAEVFHQIAPREARHTQLGLAGLAQIITTDSGRENAMKSIRYWNERVADSFGDARSSRFDKLAQFGLRKRRNEELLGDWRKRVDEHLRALAMH